MGVVYRVWDREQGTEVALKRAAHPGQDGLYRLKREFRARAGLSHPNLIQLYELVAEGDSCFFTMELVEGLTFLNWIRASRDEEDPSPRLDGATVALAATATEAVAPAVDATTDFPSGSHDLPTVQHHAGGRGRRARTAEVSPRNRAAGRTEWSAARESRVRKAMTGLLQGLAALHETGQMHRDIKSSNVLIEPSGRVVILDFGLMSSLAPYDAQSSSMEIAGTPSYMAPEHLRGDATQASDLYAAGILLYEALASRPPYRGNMFEMLEAKDAGPPLDPRSLVAGLPDDLCDLAMALVVPDADSRPTARAALAQLGEDREDSGEASALSSLDAPFVGRTQELERLREELRGLQQGGRAHTVRISGAPGAGKSRLVQSFLGECAGDVLVLSSICTRAESVPFQAMDAVVDRLARHVRDLDPADRAELVPRRAFALRRVFPSLRMVPEIALTRAPPQFDESQVEPADLRRMGFDAFRELLGRVAESRTVVLWIDDLQWADLDSVNLLLDIVGRDDAPPVLVVLTYRDVDRDTSQAIRMVERPGVASRFGPVLELRPLADDSALELMQRLAPDAEEQVVRRALQRADGNPFLAIEIARVLAIEGGAVELPEDLIDGLVARRLEGLDDGEVALVRTVSVAAAPMPISWVAQAAGVETGVMPTVRRLCDQHILRETSAEDLRFTTYHDLLRERVVASLSEESLRVEHRRLAETLEKQDELPLEALFLHWGAAEEASRAVPYGLRAASRAAETLAFESAASLYGQAIELLGDGDRTADLLERHADTLANAGRGLEAAERYLEAAGRESEELHRIRLRQQGAGHLIKAGYASRGWTVLRDVLRDLGIPVPGSQLGCVASATWRRLRFLARKPARLRGSTAEVQDSARDSRERLRSDTLWVASTSLSMLNHTLSDCFRMRHMMSALRTGSDSEVCRVLAYEVAMESHLGGSFFRGHATRLLEHVETLCRRTGDPYDEAWRQLALVNYWFTDSNWFACAQAALLAEEIFAEECVGSGWERSTAKHFRHLAQSQLGEFGSLGRGLEEGLARAESHHDVYDALNHLAPEPMLAWIARGRGEWAAGRIDQLTGRLETPGSTWPDNVFRAMDAHRTVARVLVDYSEGRCAAGHARLLGIWRDLEKSMIVKLQHGRLCYPWFRALGALGAAAQSEERRVDLEATTREVDGICRDFGKDPRPLAEGYVDHLRGGLAVLAGNADEAARRFQSARTVFEEEHVEVLAQACSYALGRLEDRDRQADRHASWRTWAQEQGVTAPEKVFRVFVPFLTPVA